MKKFNMFKTFFQNYNSKKYLNILILIVTISTVCLIGLDIISLDKSNSSNVRLVNTPVSSENNSMTNLEYSDTTEKELENILNQIKGVSQVSVMVTYETTAEVVPAMNVTNSTQESEEKDSEGGIRNTKDENITKNVVTSTDKNSLIVIKEIKPEIKGVVVVAKGAENIVIKNSIIEAVRTIFQIPSYKVMVYEKN